MTIIERASLYLDRLPPAIAGSGGHNALYEAAAVLRRGFALNEDEAFELLTRWNQTHCQPPWKECDLRHKLQSAAQSTRSLGYLLKNEDGPSPVPQTSPPFAGESEDAKKAKHRQSWPEFRPLDDAAIHAIAKLRSLPIHAVTWLARMGYLKGAMIDGQPCFILTEGSFAQARRFDGEMLQTRHGSAKTKNLYGSQGAFIGQAHLGRTNPVLMLEGAIGLLEGLAALMHTDCTNWTVLAATSSGSRFHRDPSLLERLRGRRVLIIPDADERGMEGAATWLTDLESVNASVEAIALPAGCKDLGSVLKDLQTHTEFLHTLFL